MKSIFIFMLLAASLMARAEISVKDGGALETPSFPATNPDAVPVGTIQYNYRLVDYPAWAGIEKKVLNLFDIFKPREDRPLQMFIAKATVVLNKSPDQIVNGNLRLFIDPNIFKMVDPEGASTIQSTALSAKDVITYKELSSFYRNPPEPYRYCVGHNVLCISTKFILPPNYAYLFKKYEKSQGSSYLDLQGQSELKTYSGPDLTNAGDLKALTKIHKSEPVASAVQTSFWFTHILGFAKTVVVFQPKPGNPNQTIVTTFMAFAIEHKSWDQEREIPGVDGAVKLKDVFLGQSVVTQPGGIMCGLPCMTQNSALLMTEIFNH